MIVRRLKILGLRVADDVSRGVRRALAALFGPGRRVGPSVAAPVAALATAGRVTHTEYPGYAGSNWLEDGRRLRGRPTASMPHATLSRPPTEALRQVLRDPHWTSAFEAGRLGRTARPSRPLAEPFNLDERTAPETLRAAPSRPAAPYNASDTADASEAADTEAGAREEAERRLLLIRELVRRGLYNEGFKPGYVPEQYRPRPLPPDASEPPLA